MTSTAEAVMPAGADVPAGDGDHGGRCKRPGCGRPLPPGERGRSRQFCGDECRIRHYNARRGHPAAALPPPADGPQAALGRLMQLIAEASGLAAAVSAQVAAADPGRVAAVLAEAEAARRRAEAHAATVSAQAAESAESAAAAWEAADAADAARAQAQARAQAAAERARELEQQSASTAAELTAALARAGAAERDAAQATAGRDAAARERDTVITIARQDAGHATAGLAAARRAGEQAAEQARQQTVREIAAVQAACRTQADFRRGRSPALRPSAPSAPKVPDDEQAPSDALSPGRSRPRATAAASARTRTALPRAAALIRAHQQVCSSPWRRPRTSAAAPRCSSAAPSSSVRAQDSSSSWPDARTARMPVTRSCTADRRAARIQPRTVPAGTARPEAMGRCPCPRADAARACPISPAA